MTGRDAPPLLLLATLTWTSAAGGGTAAADLAIVVALLLGALLLAAGTTGLRLRPTLIPVLVLEGWLLATGTRGVAVDLATLRVPALVLIAALAVSVTRRLDGPQRAVVLDGLVLVGTVAGAVAVGQVLAAPWPPAGPIRAAGLVGNANALGVLLVATGAVTLRALTLRAPAPHRPRLLGAALAVQAVALLLTGSRLALITALGVVLWSARHARTTRGAAVILGWSAVALVIVAARFAATGLDRTALWRAALRQIALRPLAGRGPEPVVLAVPGSPLAPTTHAHDEILQLGVEYGLVAVVLLGVVLVVALAPVTWRACDRWLLAAATPLVATGLVDIGLRVTALTLLAAVLATMAVVPPRPDRGREPTPSERTSRRTGREPCPGESAPATPR